MADAHKNFASSLVATAPSPATSGTSLVVTTGDGTKFPTAPFNATIYPAGSTPSSANAEIVRVTAISTDTLTITRTQESTSARTVGVGDVIVAGITAKTLTDAEPIPEGRGRYGAGPTALLSTPGFAAVAATTTQGMVSGRANYYPMRVVAPITIDAIVVEPVTTGTVSGRCGIYAADHNWQPTGAPLADTGVFSLAATGVIITAVSLTLQPGLYVKWSNFSASGASLRAAALSGNLLGYSPTSGFATVGQIYASQTFGAPPSTPTPWDTVFLPGSAIFTDPVFIRVAAA